MRPSKRCSPAAKKSRGPVGRSARLEVHHDHKRGKHVTLQLLHLEHKTAHPDGLSYTEFCVHYRRWLGQRDLVRLEYAAGERMFVDFAGDTVPITDPETGEV
jgi:hypothetical protein